jgi:hypothetical protein
MVDEGRLSAFEGGQDIRDRTFAFACRVVKFCEKVYASGGVVGRSHCSEDSTHATKPLSWAIGSPSQPGGVSQTNARIAITHRS